MDDYDAALAIVQDHRELAHFCGPRDPSVVEAAERALGLRLPAAYRRFALELGAGSFGAFEVYGVVDLDCEDSAVPDGVWYTLDERKSGLPGTLIVVGESGDGSLYCLEVRGDEAPVVLYEPGSGAACGERLFADFGAFLLDGVQSALGRDR